MRKQIGLFLALLLVLLITGCAQDSGEAGAHEQNKEYHSQTDQGEKDDGSDQDQSAQQGESGGMSIDPDVYDYFNSLADSYEGSGRTVTVKAPDFGALYAQVYAGAGETLSAGDWKLAAEKNPDLVQVYTLNVASVDQDTIRAAFLDAVMTDLYVASVAQMDIQLLEPGERRE